MTLGRLHMLRLRRLLLLLLVPGLLSVTAVEIWLTWRTAIDAANAAYDRSLFGAIKAMDANISTASGGLSVELPYRMLEFFQLTASGHVYFRVATENGLVEIGSADLPAPSGPLVTGKPQFHDAIYFDEPVRVGSYARLLDQPLAGKTKGQRLLIQVAESMESRQAFTRLLVLEAIARDVLLMSVATGLMVLAVGWALRPLARLRNEVIARSPQDLAPISADGVPADVKPLVEAINFHVERSRQHMLARQRFVDDASHQLRTPLTTLATQVGFALRESNPAQQHEALIAIRAQIDDTIRRTNQMLALGRVDSIELALDALDVKPLIEQITRQWWPQARANDIDLGLEAGVDQLVLSANEAMLKEALSNLLHNAVRYTPSGGQVTVSLGRNAAYGLITVRDSGPGMPPDELARAGDRFFRGTNVAQPGSGLGLAIVRSIATRMNGELSISANPQGIGLAVTIALPLFQQEVSAPGTPKGLPA